MTGLLTRLDLYDCCEDDPDCPVCEAGREIEELRSEVKRLRSLRAPSDDNGFTPPSSPPPPRRRTAVTDPQVSVEVAGVRFGRFGVSGWYRWNGRWAPIPEPLWTEPMLDKVAHLQSLIDAYADATRITWVTPRYGLGIDPLKQALYEDARRALLAAATPKEAEA